MSNGTCIEKNPLQRDGTNRRERMLDALEPGSVALHDFSTKDWMRFAYEFAAGMNFFGTGNDQLPEGDWQHFFVEHAQIDTLLLQAEQAQNTEPHLALFIAFLKLIATSQEQLNGLTKKHLDFYYKEVLQLGKKADTPDKAFVLFELAKNVLEQRIPAGALLEAGKDKNKRPLQYAVSEELVVNTAVAAQFKSIYHQKGDSIRYADIANSLDGLGAPLDKQDPLWFAFGHDNTNSKYPPLPAARLGFALASQVLLLQEGTRTIEIRLSLDVPADFDVAVFNGVADRMTALITGPKSWTNATIQSAVITRSGLTATFVIQLELDPKDDPVTAYDPLVHQEHYTTSLPVIRILFETSPGSAYKDYALLAGARMNTAVINVTVKEFKGFIAENDNGTLDLSKPFMPFGSLPRKGSGFYLGSKEIFQKQWGTLTLHIEWKDKPDKMAAHYKAYKSRFLTEDLSRQSYNLVFKDDIVQNDYGSEVGSDSHFTVDLSYVKNGKWTEPLNRELFAAMPMKLDRVPVQNNNFYWPQLLFQTGYSADKFFIQQYYANVYAPYKLLAFNPGFLLFNTKNDSFSGNVKDNFLKISLVNDFLHQYYAQLYAVAMSVEGGAAIIPKEPYTPVIASLTAEYTATAKNDFNFTGSADVPAAKLANYTDRAVQLFHETPFGQSEQHIFLREQTYTAAEAARISLLPVYDSEGACMIGLDNALTGSIVSLLFQVAEGSENPLAPSFNEQTTIEWYGLGNNEWHRFGKEYIISDSTNNFLKPGIISFLLPDVMNDSNTVLPSGMLWLKAQLPPGIHFDSVCRFVAIQTQAAEAIFKNNGNDLAHLSGPLPAGTISKLSERLGGIKKLVQLFNTFDGRQPESDHGFYLRISERLRHKNRAVNIWDYERLILSAFPDVYKVKCLNHTSSEASNNPGYEIDPGYVTVIPVPDVRNRNLYNILQPRMSSNKLRAIETYIRGLNSIHISFAAAHPDFEEVMFRFKVKFYKQYDPNAYVKILNEELKQYLAPWAYDGGKELSFGGSLYKSVVIGFIEDRSYVDFVTDFKMTVDSGNDKPVIVASTARSILTTVVQHDITAILQELPC